MKDHTIVRNASLFRKIVVNNHDILDDYDDDYEIRIDHKGKPKQNTLRRSVRTRIPIEH